MTVLLAGCIKFGGGDSKGPLGIHKSTNASANWEAINKVLNIESKLVTLDDIGINSIAIDPSNNEVIYLATTKGLYYTLDAGTSWQRVKIDQYEDREVLDVAVSHFDKCSVFVALGQYIYKTDDCLRTWRNVHYDSRSKLEITAIETESYSREIVYAGNNQGDVLRSSDYGDTWQTIKRLDSPVVQILIDKRDTRNIYVATQKEGLFKTSDKGLTWSDDNNDTDINRKIREFRDSKRIRAMVQDVTRDNTIIFASDYGLLKTSDGGANWEEIILITPAREANIYSLAIDPKDGNVIYYGTDSTLYKSVDGGNNWSTQKSPTRGTINFLLIDSENSDTIYLGAK